MIFWLETPDFECLDLGSSVDEFEFVSLFDFSREELQVDHYPLVTIILRVEDECFGYS